MEIDPMKDSIRRMLGKEPVVNRGFLRYLDVYELKRSCVSGSSCAAVFGYGPERFGVLYSRKPDEAEAVSSIFEGISGLAIEPAYPWSLKAAIGDTVPDSILDAVMLYMPEEADLPGPTEAPVPIGPKYAETIHMNYKRADDVGVDYIRERLAEGPAVGVFEEGELVGWALTHDDMAMGMLTVLPGFRRKGIALDITLALIKMMRQLGEIPIVHISKDNSMSMPLVRKMGFREICDVMFVRMGNEQRQ